MLDAETIASGKAVGPIERTLIDYPTVENEGTLIVDVPRRRLFLVMAAGRAVSYGIGVAREGFEWSGTSHVSAKREWPGWTPPPQMREREKDLPHYMEGGLDNPLGARALYLGSTLYRIHGSNEPETIGEKVSSGCIRLANRDVMDLFERVRVGARVVIIPEVPQIVPLAAAM
ncbi:MAG: L,D-transpeptidase [Hyphomicrobiales bacterium]